ncbi:hypothetical protein [Actinoallomurus acaciae]|uniref:MFS transporter n=1 Tax=Actinoallomurus acaciae TaxID=502577 RepID=A0ABV5YJM8_9ACTN
MTSTRSHAEARTGPVWMVLALACGYLLTFAGFMLLGGRAADLFGHCRMLVAGLFLFSAPSLVGGPATGLEAVGLPYQRTDRRDADRRGHAVPRRYADRPAGVVRPRRRGHRDGGAGRADLRGQRSADHGWTSVPVAAGVLLLVVFIVVEARFAARPLMPLRLFGIRGVAVGNGMLLLFGGVAIAMWYFTSLFLQNVLGYGGLRAGLGQTPAAVTFMVIARWATALLPRTGVRPLVAAGCGCLVAGFGWLSRAHADSGHVIGVLGPTLLIAVGVGLTFPTLMAAATADAPEGDAGIIGGSVGLAVLATAAGAGTREAGGNSPAALAAGYDRVFLLAAGLGLVMAAAGLLLPRRPRG